MKEFFMVKITEENGNGHVHRHRYDEDTLINAARITLSFRPKRGYKIRTVNIERRIKLL